MEKIELPIELSQLIVDGILKGYKDYLAVRKRAQDELKISGAYAWVKGNHIDSSVDETCSKYKEIESSIEKAGYTWEYIQFVLKESKEKYLVIVKNSRGIKKTFNGKIDKVKKENYLYEYAGINNSIIKSKAVQSVQLDEGIQLELSLPEIEAIQKNVALSAPEGYNRFYVVTYQFDEEKMISKIALTLPNQKEMSLIEIADLTPLISTSEFKIHSIELEVVQGDKVPDSIYGEDEQLFGYEVAAEKKSGSEREAN